MKNKFLIIIILASILYSCNNNNEFKEKGFSISHNNTEEQNIEQNITKDSTIFETRPRSVILTSNPKIRLTTIYKVNYNKDQTSFIGSNSCHYNYSELGYTNGNQWNYNFLPGFEALYGYNLVNVSHFNTETKNSKNIFEKPVLIKTIYNPSFSNDTLNYKPVNRNYIMISVYDDDTNKDSFINLSDLRRLYYFDINAENKTPLVPLNYSVMKSEYDPGNDYMYVFAKQDTNNNGQVEDKEPIHIFLVDLNNPTATVKLY